MCNTSDVSQLSIHAALRQSDGALTILVINKYSSSITSPLSFSGFTPIGNSAKVYQYTGNTIVQQSNQALNGNSFSATYPASSLTMFEISGPTTSSSSSSKFNVLSNIQIFLFLQVQLALLLPQLLQLPLPPPQVMQHQHQHQAKQHQPQAEQLQVKQHQPQAKQLQVK